MSRPQLRDGILFGIGLLLLTLAALFPAFTGGSTSSDGSGVPDSPVDAQGGKSIALDAPSLAWSEGWRITSEGATPPEPADPMTTPAGTLRFTYRGATLALDLKPGDYWAYLYVTVDGAPANLLPSSAGHDPAPVPTAGYLSLYKPEADPAGVRVTVHRADDAAATHEVEIAFWRGWGETPLLGIVVDAPDAQTTDAFPLVFGAIALVLMSPAMWRVGAWIARLPGRSHKVQKWAQRLLLLEEGRVAVVGAAAGFVLAAGGVWLENPLVCWAGLAMLGLASLLRPAFWYAALFFALPFYYSFALPIPGRSINLVDAGAWLGLAIAVAHVLLVLGSGRTKRTRIGKWALLLLALLALWAAISMALSDNVEIARREWRTVFVAAVVIGAGLSLLLRFSSKVRGDLVLLVGGWLAGATLFAGLGLWLYPADRVIIAAEGVQRLRGFYGSPNNLALYLDRTLAVTLALLLFARLPSVRLAALVGVLVQLAAFLLTFSKGGLFLALPAMGVALWGAGLFTLRRQGRSTRVLWTLAGAALLVAVAMIPFLGTERFDRILDLASGTGFLRVNLWRASWQMALDNALFGVGPDGFLYAYRSQYLFPQAWMEPNLNHPHNWLLDWWTRLGIPGLLLGMAFWGVLLGNLVRNLRWAGISAQGGAEWDALQVGLFAATIAALAHGLVDLSYALPDLMAVWVLMAMLSSVEPFAAVEVSSVSASADAGNPVV